MVSFCGEVGEVAAEEDLEEDERYSIILRLPLNTATMISKLLIQTHLIAKSISVESY